MVQTIPNLIKFLELVIEDACRSISGDLNRSDQLIDPRDPIQKSKISSDKSIS